MLVGWRGAHQHRDILLAVHRIADRRGADAGAGIEAPQLLQRLGVIGREGAVEMAEEDQVAGGRQRAGKVRVVELGRCLDVAGERDRPPSGRHGDAPAIRAPPPVKRSRNFEAPPWSSMSFCSTVSARCSLRSRGCRAARVPDYRRSAASSCRPRSTGTGGCSAAGRGCHGCPDYKSARRRPDRS